MCTVVIYIPDHKNNFEVIYVLFILLINCGLFAYSINERKIIKKKKKILKKKKKKKINNKFMR
jgi:hypothetical protein